jgi:hypothetical protein
VLTERVISEVGPLDVGDEVPVLRREAVLYLPQCDVIRLLRRGAGKTNPFSYWLTTSPGPSIMLIAMRSSASLLLLFLRYATGPRRSIKRWEEIFK